MNQLGTSARKIDRKLIYILRELLNIKEVLVSKYCPNCGSEVKKICPLCYEKID